MKLNSVLAPLVTVACCLVPAIALAQSTTLKYGDDQADGKKSLGGSGEIVAFALPGKGSKVAGIRIHGSRYGTPDSHRSAAGEVTSLLPERQTSVGFHGLGALEDT